MQVPEAASGPLRQSFSRVNIGNGRKKETEGRAAGRREGKFPAELKRIFGITDGIMRSIVIRHGDDKEITAEA